MSSQKIASHWRVPANQDDIVNVELQQRLLWRIIAAVMVLLPELSIEMKFNECFASSQQWHAWKTDMAKRDGTEPPAEWDEEKEREDAKRQATNCQCKYNEQRAEVTRKVFAVLCCAPHMYENHYVDSAQVKKEFSVPSYPNGVVIVQWSAEDMEATKGQWPAFLDDTEREVKKEAVVDEFQKEAMLFDVTTTEPQHAASFTTMVKEMINKGVAVVSQVEQIVALASSFELENTAVGNVSISGMTVGLIHKKLKEWSDKYMEERNWTMNPAADYILREIRQKLPRLLVKPSQVWSSDYDGPVQPWWQVVKDEVKKATIATRKQNAS